MLKDPFDDVVWMRRVTFCLPEAAVVRGLPDLMTESSRSSSPSA